MSYWDTYPALPPLSETRGTEQVEPRPRCERVLAALQAHSSVRKACMVSVTPHVRVIPTREDNAFSMEPALLEAAIKEDLAAGARTCRQHACSSGNLASSCMPTEALHDCRVPNFGLQSACMSAECRVPAWPQSAGMATERPTLLYCAAWLKAVIGEARTEFKRLASSSVGA